MQTWVQRVLPAGGIRGSHAADHRLRPGAEDHSLHLMVQCMEAWLVADPDCLKAYYGRGFNERRLPESLREAAM